jgi:hypothetical protein
MSVCSVVLETGIYSSCIRNRRRPSQEVRSKDSRKERGKREKGVERGCNVATPEGSFGATIGVPQYECASRRACSLHRYRDSKGRFCNDVVVLVVRSSVLKCVVKKIFLTEKPSTAHLTLQLYRLRLKLCSGIVLPKAQSSGACEDTTGS